MTLRQALSDILGAAAASRIIARFGIEACVFAAAFKVLAWRLDGPSARAVVAAETGDV